MKNNYVVLDAETGDLDPYVAPITQLAVQVVSNENLKLLERWDTFVKPYFISEAAGDKGYKISKTALERSQVTMTQINAGMDYKELLKKLIDTFTSATNRGGKISYKPIIVGHNTGFDMGFLEVLFALFNKDLYDYVNKYFVDTQQDMQRHDGYIKSKEDKVKFNLGACCDRMGIKLKSAHGAPADVAATTSLFIMLTKKMQNKGGTIVEEQRDGTKDRQPFEM